MVAETKMHKIIYKYSIIASVFVFSLLSFSSLANASLYGEYKYNEGTYSTYIAPVTSTGTSQEFRDKFLAEHSGSVGGSSSSTTTTTTSTATVTNTTTPVTTTGGGSSLSITRTLRQGMKGNDVKDLQTYLNSHGYNCGTPDGSFGAKTKAAVILFQKAKGLTADGVVGPKTVNIMNEGASTVETAPAITTPPTTPSTTAPASTARILRLGMSGDDVKTLQVYLNTHGYVISETGVGSPGNETTYFGAKTKAAVILFQKANGLTADGVVGPKTVELLK